VPPVHEYSQELTYLKLLNIKINIFGFFN